MLLKNKSKMERTTKIANSEIANLMLYFMIFRDYENNKDIHVEIGSENHRLSNFFLILGNVPEEYVQELEWDTFKNLNDLKKILEYRQHEDKAIIIDLKKNRISRNTTISNVHNAALNSFNILFSENIKRFSTLKKKYFPTKVGTKREYALAIHLATSNPVIITTQTVVNSLSTGSLYYFVSPGVYLRAYLKQVFSLPYSYYVDPANFAALIVEIYSWNKMKRSIKLLKKEIINWKEYFNDFIKTLVK